MCEIASMLIIAGTFEVDPGRRDEFIAGKEAGMRESRGEAGCIAYVVSADPLEPGRVYLYERWESKEHLAPHLARMGAERAKPDPDAVPVLSADIQQYEIGAVGPVGS
jgi:quinol monooxygenase YgiN